MPEVAAAPPVAWVRLSPFILSKVYDALLVNVTPLWLVVVFCRATVTWMTAWPPTGISMPLFRSWRMILVAVPVLVRFQVPPDMTWLPTKVMLAAERARLSRILTSYRGMLVGVAGTLMR